MGNFLRDNYLSIVSVFLILGLIIWLVINKKWKILRELAYEAIIKAEVVFTGSKRGQDKFNAVFDHIYDLMPIYIRIFLPENYIKAKLQEWYNDIKDDLRYGKKIE